jgi:hypothetical protein
VVPEALTRHLTREADFFLNRVKNFDVKHVAKITWALASLGMADERKELVTKYWGHVMQRLYDGTARSAADQGSGSWAHVPPAVLVQLVQTEMFAKEKGVELSPRVPDEALDLVENYLRKVQPRNEYLTVAYSNALARMGFAHETYAYVDEHERMQTFRSDIVNAEKKICINFCGPSMFLTDVSGDKPPEESQFHRGRETGDVVARRRLMRSWGWHVIDVPYFHDKMLGEEGDVKDAKREAYMLGRFKHLGLEAELNEAK